MVKKSKQKNIKEQALELIKNKKKLLAIIGFSFFILIIIFGTLSSHNKKKRAQELSQKQEKIEKSTTSLNFPTKEDIALGDENAPITIIEYASLSCPHCANFNNKVYPKIEKKYINTGKVKFIYRDFPLNQSALLASLTSLCHARNNENNPKKYYGLVKLLFKKQESWAFDAGYFEKIKSLASLNGMSASDFDKCMANKELMDEVMKNRLRAAQELQINSTPSFIVNGKLIGGYRNFKEFSEIIDNQLNNL